jgi:hypothetical protein
MLLIVLALLYCLGHAIVARVLGEHDTRVEHDAMSVLRPDQAAVVDDDGAVIPARFREEVSLVLFSRHSGRVTSSVLCPVMLLMTHALPLAVAVNQALDCGPPRHHSAFKRRARESGQQLRRPPR